MRQKHYLNNTPLFVQLVLTGYTEKSLNNKIENSHLQFRRREKMMNKFRSMKSLQKFTAIHSTFLNHFNHQRHIETRDNFKKLRQESVASWRQIYVI